MKWYAVRTSPGAQMPRREYAVETTKSAKGYRIVPSLDPDVSAVERALADGGFQFYMPGEFKAVRSRRKTGTYTLRRFALLPGYVFVHGVTDWLKLHGTAGVAGVVAIDGVPLPIAVGDIITLRTIEARSQAKAEVEVVRMASAENAKTVKTANKALALAKRRLNPGQRVRILWGYHAGREATLAGWDDQQRLKAIVSGLDAAKTVCLQHDAVRMVA